MSDRERLEEIIARELCPYAWLDDKPKTFLGDWPAWRDPSRVTSRYQARAILAAAERAGFEWKENAMAGNDEAMRLCAPRDQQNGPRWMLIFEDASRGYLVFAHEVEARATFDRAETMGWNCHLWTLAAREASS